MLITLWAGFLLLCTAVGLLDLWLCYGEKVTRFFRRFKPKRKHKAIQFMSIRVEYDPRTKQTRIVQQFDDKISVIEPAGKLGDDMFCPIVNARCMANLLGLKPDGKNSWSNRS